MYYLTKTPEQLAAWGKRELPIKDIAFTSSARSGSFWGLSIVVMNEAGHHRVPDVMCLGGHDEVARFADDINRALGLTLTQAMLYVSSSMVGLHNRAVVR